MLPVWVERHKIHCFPLHDHSGSQYHMSGTPGEVMDSVETLCLHLKMISMPILSKKLFRDIKLISAWKNSYHVCFIVVKYTFEALLDFPRCSINQLHGMAVTLKTILPVRETHWKCVVIQ